MHFVVFNFENHFQTFSVSNVSHSGRQCTCQAVSDKRRMLLMEGATRESRKLRGCKLGVETLGLETGPFDSALCGVSSPLFTPADHDVGQIESLFLSIRGI